MELGRPLGVPSLKCVKRHSLLKVIHCWRPEYVYKEDSLAYSAN
jgi:hypothetical protein